MPLPTVGITLNLFDGAGNQVTAGSAVFTPTIAVSSADGTEEFAPQPLTVRLDSGSFPVTALLLPTDMPASPDWAWQVSFTGVALEPFTFKLPAGPVSFTGATGTPGVVTWTATGAVTSLPPGTGVKLAGGSLPAGVTAGTLYYVLSPSGQTLNLSATPGGSAIAFTGSGSGTLTVASYYVAGLVPLGSATSYSPYLTAPPGSPAAGEVLVTTGTGTGTTWRALTASDAGAVPVTELLALSLNTYSDAWQHTITGQTVTGLGPFGLRYGSQSYARGGYSAIQGPAMWLGYNVPHFTGVTSAHGAIGISIFGSAGDTNNGAGGYGLECNVGFVSAGGVAVNSFEAVAVDDETGTLNATLRCGKGTSNGVPSAITLENADSTVQYLQMGPVYGDQVKAFRPLTVTFDMNALALPALRLINTNAAAGSSTLQLDVGNNAGLAQLAFANAGVNKWVAGYSAALAGDWFVEDVANARFPVLIAPGASAIAQQITLDGQVTHTSSVIVGKAVLANSATDGFLYLPSVAGTPTGVPAAKTGTAPVVLDTTAGKLWAYTGGSWKGIALT